MMYSSTMFQNMIRGRALKAQVNQYLTDRAGGWRVDLERIQTPIPPSPLRRSQRSRVPEAERKKVEEEKVLSLLAITDDSSHGLTITHNKGRGRGVMAMTSFSKGDFVVQYSGDYD